MHSIHLSIANKQFRVHVNVHVVAKQQKKKQGGSIDGMHQKVVFLHVFSPPAETAEGCPGKEPTQTNTYMYIGM